MMFYGLEEIPRSWQVLHGKRTKVGSVSLDLERGVFSRMAIRHKSLTRLGAQISDEDRQPP